LGEFFFDVGCHVKFSVVVLFLVVALFSVVVVIPGGYGYSRWLCPTNLANGWVEFLHLMTKLWHYIDMNFVFSG
jgi:hypothetical protein